MQQLSVHQLAEWLGDANRQPPLLLDVREPWEYELCHLTGSRHLPMHAVPGRIAELEDAEEIVVICHHGARSMQVAMFLERSGLASVYNLTGGVEAWAQAIDPGMRRY
ncbi:MAG TPA: rhodanese-like domain-containing protein [Rhodocyclaceae bacterium]|nr:rhodanese-like domain-containing protein [Rhodocyclaceae bacterium]